VSASQLRLSKSTVVHVSFKIFLNVLHVNANSRFDTLTDKIVKALGEGGFSFVYLAQDEVTGVSVILGVFNSEMSLEIDNWQSASLP